MNISDLTKENKAVKLRYFDKETKSKILMDVKWHLLGGNKLPYLSVDVRQVKLNGEIVNGWQEQKQAIAKLNQDYSNLINSHLCNTDGNGMHQASNMLYHFKQAKNTFGQDVYTSEKHQEKLKKLWQSLENHKLYEWLFIDFGNSKDHYFKEYLNKNSDHYNYSNADRSIKHWLDQIKITCFDAKKKREQLSSLLTSYFETIDEYRSLEQDYKYKNLPNNSDVWTPQRLADTYNLTLEEVFTILSTPDMEPLVQVYSEKIKESNYKKLKELTEKYKIPLVISK